MKIKSKREEKMSKKGLKRKIVAGLVALAVFVTSAGMEVDLKNGKVSGISWIRLFS